MSALTSEDSNQVRGGGVKSTEIWKVRRIVGNSGGRPIDEDLKGPSYRLKIGEASNWRKFGGGLRQINGDLKIEIEFVIGRTRSQTPLRN